MTSSKLLTCWTKDQKASLVLFLISTTFLRFCVGRGFFAILYLCIYTQHYLSLHDPKLVTHSPSTHMVVPRSRKNLFSDVKFMNKDPVVNKKNMMPQYSCRIPLFLTRVPELTSWCLLFTLICPHPFSWFWIALTMKLAYALGIFENSYLPIFYSSSPPKSK